MAHSAVALHLVGKARAAWCIAVQLARAVVFNVSRRMQQTTSRECHDDTPALQLPKLLLCLGVCSR
jgi:hypothetical protein